MELEKVADESGAIVPDPSSDVLGRALEVLEPDDAEARQALALLADRNSELQRKLIILAGHESAEHAFFQEESWSQEWTGPLPSPEDMAAFNQVQPDLGERIIRMREIVVDHEIAMDQGTLELNQSVVNAENWMGYLGLGAAFLLSAGSIAAAVLLGLAGHIPVALPVGLGIPAMLLATTFARLRRRRSEETTSSTAFPGV